MDELEVDADLSEDLVHLTDDDLDAKELRSKALQIKRDRSPCTPDEQAVVAAVESTIGSLPSSAFKELASPDPDVLMSLGFVEGSKIGVCRAETTVDAAAEECVAHNILKETRAAMKRFSSLGGRETTVIPLTDHSFLYQTLVDHGIPGFVPREYVSHVVWERQREDTYVIAYKPYIGEEFPIRPKFVRATGSLLLRLKRLPPLHGYAQTQLELTKQGDLRGVVPAVLINRLAVTQLGYAVEVKNSFDKSREIDDRTWSSTPRADELDERDKNVEAERMERALQGYTEDEKLQLAEVAAKFSEEQLPAGSFTTLKSAGDWRVEKKLAVAEGSRIACVQGTAIMDADCYQCAAYQVLRMSRAMVKSHKGWAEGGGQELNATELNGHSFIYQITIDHKIPGFAIRDEELKIVEEGLALFEMFEGEKGKVVKLPGSLATAKVSRKKGDNHAYGWATTTVRASAVQVLAFAWDVMSRNEAKEDDLERVIDERPSNHNFVGYSKKRLPRPLNNRDFVSRFIWKAQGTGHVLVQSPTSTVARPLLKDTVRAKYLGAMRIVKINDSETRLEYVCRPDAGGSVPAFIANSLMTRFVSYPTEIQEYFQKVRPLSNWDAKDGRAVGEVLLTKLDAESKKVRPTHLSWEEARMRFLFAHYEGLREAGERWEWLETMLARVVKNKLRPPASVSTRLVDLARADAKAIGAGLATSLVSNATSDAAVAEWIAKYPALTQFDQQRAWFRPMMNVVGKRLLSKSKLGAKFRLYSGAGMSMFDLYSDVQMIALYLSSEETVGYGYALLGMVLFGLTGQLQVIWFQTKGGPRFSFLKGTLMVVTGTKVGFDAHRVAKGEEKKDYGLLSPDQELFVTKLQEMMSESIPGCVMQLYVIILLLRNGGEIKTVAL
ncbi:hypothetical protein TeGR_g216, partial [Tetraparma gracilis]